MSRKDVGLVRCLWCGRQPVRLKRGRLVSHLTPGGQKCVGIGQVSRIGKYEKPNK